MKEEFFGFNDSLIRVFGFNDKLMYYQFIFPLNLLLIFYCLRKLSGIPPLLAPLLGNSPCTSWHVRRPRKSGRGTTAAPYWTVNMADQVTRTSISPLVDRDVYL